MILGEAEALLDPVSDIDGFMLACLVDASTGMVLASRKDQDEISLPTAAAGAADIANVLALLAGQLPVDGLEDVMVTFRRQLYMIDAALELLSAQSRYARFRPSRVPDTGLAPDISVEALLAEVTRRQRVLAQLSAVLTADTALARNPQIHPESIRVSALQWSLLIRVRHGTTPRELAWDLSRGVFGMTVEVHRLLVRRLLSVAGDPPGSVGRAGASPVVMSSVRAVSVEKGETVPPFNADGALGGAG